MNPRISRSNLAIAMAAGFVLSFCASSRAMEARVTSMTGSKMATYIAQGQGAGEALKVGQDLSASDQIKTDPNTQVNITFTDGSKVQVGAGSEFTLNSRDDANVEVNVGLGSLYAWVHQLATRAFSIRTPSAVASVRGTEVGVRVGGDGKVTWTCPRGRFVLRDNKTGNSYNVDSGKQIVVNVDGSYTPPTKITDPSLGHKAEPKDKLVTKKEGTTEQPKETTPPPPPPPPPPPNPVQENKTSSPSGH